MGSYTNLIRLDDLSSPINKKEDCFIFSNENRKNSLNFKDLKSKKLFNTYLKVNVEKFNSEKNLTPMKTPISKPGTPDTKVHKVSLKNSLNQDKTLFKKFEITMEEKIKLPSTKEIHIVFVIHKNEWVNGKSKSLLIRNQINLRFQK